MTSTQALAASPKTFAERDNWMRAILASDLPDAAVRVAIRIALHLHVNTGRCDPSYIALATDSNVSERSVYRLDRAAGAYRLDGASSARAGRTTAINTSC